MDFTSGQGQWGGDNTAPQKPAGFCPTATEKSWISPVRHTSGGCLPPFPTILKNRIPGPTWRAQNTPTARIAGIIRITRTRQAARRIRIRRRGPSPATPIPLIRMMRMARRIRTGRPPRRMPPRLRDPSLQPCGRVPLWRARPPRLPVRSPKPPRPQAARLPLPTPAGPARRPSRMPLPLMFPTPATRRRPRPRARPWGRCALRMWTSCPVCCAACPCFCACGARRFRRNF